MARTQPLPDRGGRQRLSQQQLVDIRDQVQMLTQFMDYGGLVTASSCSVVMVNAPHPNAAKVYLNWLLGKDGQTAWSTALNQPSRAHGRALRPPAPELVPKPARSTGRATPRRTWCASRRSTTS